MACSRVEAALRLAVLAGSVVTTSSTASIAEAKNALISEILRPPAAQLISVR